MAADVLLITVQNDILSLSPLSFTFGPKADLMGRITAPKSTYVKLRTRSLGSAHRRLVCLGQMEG